MTDQVRKVIAPFASLRLTVVLLTLLMLLIFFSTLAQRTHGIWWVMDQYMTSWAVWVPLQIFVFVGRTVPGAFPFPGGALLGLLVLINLLAAHSMRFKLRARGLRLVVGTVALFLGTAAIIWFQSWHVIGPIKASIGVAGMLLVGLVVYLPAIIGTALLFGRRVGIVLIHGSLILLIVGEGVTRMTALETQMPIYEGQTIQWSQDSRVTELAVIRRVSDDATTEQVIAIPQSRLEQAAEDRQPITHDELPFDVQVDQFMINSMFSPYQRGIAPPPGVLGIAQTSGLIARPRATGVGDAQMDFPGAWITLRQDGKPIGRFAVSSFTMLMGDLYQTLRQDVEVDGQTWQLDMRFKRYYKPYAFRLVKFTHDLYPGTQIPLNYASDIVITEPDEPEGREVHIRMNQPLRFGGDTYFQSGYIQDPRGGPDLGTVLQVVRNPGSTMPYIACALGGIGLLVHFVWSLWRYLTRPNPRGARA